MFPSDEELVKHIRDEAILIQKFMVGKAVDDLRSDFMLERAVTRWLEIMGEASRKISTEFKLIHSGLPWRDMQDTRNRIIHFYFGIDYGVIMNIIQVELPPLLQSLELLLEKSEKQSKSTDLLSQTKVDPNKGKSI